MMCMKFKFISIGTYLSGFTLCVVVMLTTSDPISLGTISDLNVLGTVEKHWVIGLFMKVVAL